MIRPLSQVLWLMRLGSRLFSSRPAMPRTLPTRQVHADEEKGRGPRRAIVTYMLCHLTLRCSSHAQCEQLNNGNPSQKDRKRYRIVFEQVPTYMHDVLPCRRVGSRSHGQWIANTARWIEFSDLA